MEENDEITTVTDTVETPDPARTPVEYVRKTRADRLRENAQQPDFAAPKAKTTDMVFKESVMNLTPSEINEIIRNSGIKGSAWEQTGVAIENALTNMNQLPDELAISVGNLSNYITGGQIGQELQDVAFESLKERMADVQLNNESVGGVSNLFAQIAGGSVSFIQLALEGLATGGYLSLVHIGAQSFGEGVYNDMKKYADEHDGSLKGYRPNGTDLAINTANMIMQVAIEEHLGVGSPRFLRGWSRGFWKEAGSGFVQEAAQDLLSDFAEVLKGNEGAQIMMENADQYLLDGLIGAILQGPLGAVTYSQARRRSDNIIAMAHAQVKGRKEPIKEDFDVAKKVNDAKERNYMTAFTEEFKAAFDASTGEGKLQANIAKAINDAVAAQELDLGVDDETERAQRVEQIATQETLNAMEQANEQGKSIAEMGINNIVYKDNAIWLEGMTPEVGQRAVDYARVLAERQTGLAEVQMKLDNINAEIKQTKVELAEAKAQSKEAFVDKLQARLDKQNALAEKRKVQAEQLKAQTEKIQRQIAKELEKAPKQAETKVEEVKAVEEPQKTETQVEMPESKVEVPETKVESAPAKEEPKAEQKPMASIKENMQAYKGEKKSLAVERSGGYKLKVDGELVKVIEKPKGVDFSDAKVYEDKSTYLPKCSMVVKGDNIYIKMFGSRTFPTTYLVIENYKATDPGKIMQAQYDADTGLGNHFEDMIKEFYLKNGLWSLNEGMRLKDIDVSIAEDKAREEQQPETREFEAITGSLDTFDARGRMKKSVQNRILNVLTDEQKNKKITTSDGKTTTVGELLIDALSERVVKSKISFDQRKGGIFDDISDEQLDKIIRIARGIDEESVAKRNKPKADYSFPALSEEERNSLPTYDADGNIKPETWDKIRGLFSEERLKKEYKTADGGTETLEDVLKKSVATRDIIWKAVPNEMIKKGAKAYDMTPEELSEVLKIARGQDAVAKTPTAEEQTQAWKKAEEITNRVLENISDEEKALSKKTGAVKIKGKNGTIYSPVKSEGDIFIKLTPQIDDVTHNWVLKYQTYARNTKPSSMLGGYGGEFGLGSTGFGRSMNLDSKEEVETAIKQIVEIYGKDNVFFGEEFVDEEFSDYQKEYKRPEELDWKNKEIRDIVNDLWQNGKTTTEENGIEKWQAGKTYQDNDIVILPYKGNPIGVREGDRWLVAESAEEAIRISNDRKQMAKAQKEYEKKKAREKAEAQKKMEEDFLSDEGTAVIPMDYIIEKLKYYDMWDDLKLREKGNMNAIGSLVFQDGEIKRGHRNEKTKKGSTISQKTIDTVQEVRRRMKKVAQDIKAIGEANQRRANEYMEAQDAKKPHGEPMEDWTGKTPSMVADEKIKKEFDAYRAEISTYEKQGVITDVDAEEQSDDFSEIGDGVFSKELIDYMVMKYNFDPRVVDWIKENPDLMQNQEDQTDAWDATSGSKFIDVLGEPLDFAPEGLKQIDIYDQNEPPFDYETTVYKMPQTQEEFERKVAETIVKQATTALELEDSDAKTFVENDDRTPYLFQSKVEGTGSDTKRGGYDDRLKRIILKDDADLTTIQHEFAHYWIQNNFKWARSGLASAEWLSRWRGVEEALGIEPQDRYLSRQASEKFARAYERYIMEGKYNEDLKWAFDGFQKFYQDTYEDLESEYFDLSEELDPAIVDWFNRQRPATEAQLKQNAYKKVATVAMAQGASIVTPVNENVSVVSNMNENGEIESQVITTDAETKDSKLAKFSDKKKARRTVEGLREINPDVKADQYNVLNRAQTVEEAHNWIVRDRAGAWAALNDETTNPIDRAALFQAFKNEAENGDYALGAELAAIKFPKNVTELGQAISVLGERAEFDPLTIIEQKQKSLGEPTETEIASEIKEMGLDADLTDEDVNELKNSTECVL